MDPLTPTKGPIYPTEPKGGTHMNNTGGKSDDEEDEDERDEDEISEASSPMSVSIWAKDISCILIS